MTAKDCVLIITGSSLTGSSTYSRLFSFLKEKLNENCCIASLVPIDTPVGPAQNKTKDFVLPRSIQLNRLGKKITKNEERVHFLLRKLYFLQLKKLVPQIAEFATANGATRIISFLDHPASIWLTKRVAAALGLSHSTFAGSVPELMLVYAGYDARSSRLMMQEFAETVKSASPAAFCTEEMKNHYSEKFNSKGISIELPPGKSVKPPPALSEADITIGCLLNATYSASTAALITALQGCDWRFESKRIQIKMIGSPVGTEFAFRGDAADIEIRSGLSDEQVVETLAQCTFNYVPYWTSPDYSLAAKVTLPDNMQFYLSARKPLLVNALTPSILNTLTSDYKLGITIASLKEKEVFAYAIANMLQLADSGKSEFSRLEQERFSQKSLNEGLGLLIGLQSEISTGLGSRTN